MAEPARTPPSFKKLPERTERHMDTIEDRWSAFLRDEEQA